MGINSKSKDKSYQLCFIIIIMIKKHPFNVKPLQIRLLIKEVYNHSRSDKLPRLHIGFSKNMKRL